MRRETSSRPDQLSFREPVGARGWIGVPIVLVAVGFTVAVAIALLAQPAASSPGMAAIGFAMVTRGSSVPTMRTILTLAGPTGEILIGRHDQDAPILRMAEDVSGFLGLDIKDVRQDTT